MEEQEPKKEMTVAEAGRRGGKRVKEKYGPEFYSKIGSLGGAVTKAKYGSDFYKEIGAKGGEVNKQKQVTNPEHFKTIGAQGGQKVKDLIAEGKRLSERGE